MAILPQKWSDTSIPPPYEFASRNADDTHVFYTCIFALFFFKGTNVDVC